MKSKQKKADIEKPVFCIVEQNRFPANPRYRVAIFPKLVDGKIIIDRLEHTLLASEQPSINGHYFRQWVSAANEKHQAEQKALQAQRAEAQKALKARSAEEEQQKQDATRRLWEERGQQRREANRQERVQGAKQAGELLKQMSIMNRKMEEVETGERCL